MEVWSKLSKMSPDTVKSMQNTLLAKFLKEEIPRHPYYRRLLEEQRLNPEDIRGVEDLARLPFTSKGDLHSPGDPQHPWNFALEGESKSQPAKDGENQGKKDTGKEKKGWLGGWWKKKKPSGEEEADPYRLYQLYYTGGRTAKPVPVVYTTYDINNLREIGKRCFDMWGLTREETVVNAFSFTPNLSFWQHFYTTVSLGATALQSGGGRVLGTEKILKALYNLEAPVFMTHPNYADHCLQVLSYYGFPLPSLSTIILGMDDIPLAMVERISQGMGKINCREQRVHRIYFLSEAKGGWPECAPGYGYHLHPDHVLAEVVDPETGEIKGEEEPGELVITNLDAKGSVWLRFRSGDLTTGGITYQPCPNCGRAMPRILGDIERKEHFFLINQDQVGEKPFMLNFNHLRRFLYAQEKLSQWYLEISSNHGKKEGKEIREPKDPTEKKGDQLKLHIAPASGVSGEVFKQELKASLEKEYLLSFSVEEASWEHLLQRQGMEKNLTDTRVFDLRE